MLGQRYRFDNQPIVQLNSTQEKFLAVVTDKITSGFYAMETVPCLVCEDLDFETLSEKDRFGLPVKTVVCRTCGLVQQNPRFTKEAARSFYEREYRGMYSGSEIPTEFFFERQKEHGERIAQLFQSVCGLGLTTWRGKMVAEIGTGAGGILDRFKIMGSSIIGVDLDRRYIAYGRNRGLDIRFGTVDIIGMEDSPPPTLFFIATC